jgi:uncharacterized metal-binding protein YceD (DUF177 family)
MTAEKPPLERFTDLDRLGQAGADVTIGAKGDDLARLAKWAKVESIEAFSADVELRRLSQTRFKLDYSLTADITQACVVTLDPVRSHIAREFSRELHVTGHSPADKGGVLTFDAGDDEALEEVASPHFDLAGPLLEEFLLAIDPYPRAEGVAFETPQDADDTSGNPFAVLKSLKKGK